ncbi:class I SAM-dependent methyltransferase [Streptomyces sp. 1222.5]|uniref:class I SAM-dependent methyltransferase n=1 Tax=Streptomyces sp. 1222.5 TaxID=1881026 RepID=UPI003EBDF15A
MTEHPGGGVEEMPSAFFDQQYSRSAMYLSHARFIREHIRGRRGEGLKLIEFGGSNGFIRDLCGEPGYEVAPNAPSVDLHDLSRYAAESFDFVILDEILEHVERPWEAVDEVHRILKKGGCFITSSPFMIAEHKVPHDYWRFTKDGLRVLLHEFAEVETHSWGNAPSVTYLMKGMMVSVRQAIEDGVFDLDNVEKYAISVWAYAWK